MGFCRPFESCSGSCSLFHCSFSVLMVCGPTTTSMKILSGQASIRFALMCLKITTEHANRFPGRDRWIWLLHLLRDYPCRKPSSASSLRPWLITERHTSLRSSFPAQSKARSQQLMRGRRNAVGARTASRRLTLTTRTDMRWITTMAVTHKRQAPQLALIF